MTPDQYIKQQLGDLSVALAVLRSENDQLKEELQKLKEGQGDLTRNTTEGQNFR